MKITRHYTSLLLAGIAGMASIATAKEEGTYTGFDPVTNESTGMRRYALPSANGKETKVPYTRQALNSNGISVPISEDKYYDWGPSFLEVDGKIHIFHCRWQGSMENWTNGGEIVHYVGDKAEGPFTLLGTIIDNKMVNEIGFRSPVNPRLEKVDGKFALFFIAQGKVRADCSIFLATADDINGSWELSGKDGIVLRGSEDPDV